MSQGVDDQIGNYLIEALIGEGGMASVYRVRHLALGSTHAVKVLHAHLARREDVRQRFLEEGKIQARLRHPNILPVTDIISEPGVAGLVMEFLEGEDLGEWLDRHGTAPISTAIGWIQQALDALGFVHQHQVVHRDLKPSNLFLARGPRDQISIRVMDFGIAKIRERERQLTNPDMGKMGTLRYMSPEQLERPEQVDHRTDLFALGAILYEALVGRSPFDDESDFHVMKRIAEGRYTAPDDTIPPAVIRILAQALETDPDKRFASAEAFSEALEEAMRADRYQRARRLLHAVTSAGLPHQWWIPPDPDEAWLQLQEARLREWCQDNGVDEPAMAPDAPAAAPPEPAPARGPEQLTLPGDVSLSLVAIPPDQFTMGSPPDEPGRHADEGPLRTVSLTGLSILATPVTQAQWTAISDGNPAMFSGEPDRPVERVRWPDAIRYANRLSAHFGLKAAYFFENGKVRWDRTAEGFRLPTEAEWEHACRAGTRTATWWGDEDREQAAWYAGNSDGKTQPVATRAPNPWGLFDMNGNVYEWCWDRLGPYVPEATDNPVGADNGEYRVLRGGSFRSEPGDLRAAFRNGREPDFCHQSVGLRLVRGAPLSADE